MTHAAHLPNSDLPQGHARGDWSALVQLFADASPMRMGHWNPLTGETFVLPRGKKGLTPAAKAARSAFELRLLAEEGWQEVPFQESDDAFDLAVRWAESLEAGRGKAEIITALQADKPFRQLRVVLAQRPGLARRYERVQVEEAEGRLTEFCVSLGLTLAHPRFAELAPHFADPDEPEDVPVPRVRAVSALSIGKVAPKGTP